MAENYVWKETAVNAAKAAQNTNPAPSSTIGNTSFSTALSTNQPTTTQKTTTPSTGFADYFKQMQSVGTTQQAPKTYDATLGGTVGQGAFTQALQTAQTQLGTQATGDSTSSRLARAGFNRAAQEATRGVLETSALGGRAQTGQIAGDQLKYVSQTVLPQRANLEAQLQSQEETQAAEERQQGFQNILNLEQLGQTAKQFASKQEFDIWAQQANLSEADKDRAFNMALEDSKQKFQTGERIAANEFSLYQDSLSREFEEKQAELNRQAQLGLVDKNLEADLQRIQKEQEYANTRFFAQMAQDNDIAMKQLGLDKEKLELSKYEVLNTIKNEAERLGMDKAAFANENVMRQIEIANIMMQMDDSDEMTEIASNMVMDAIQAGGFIKPTTTTTTTQKPIIVDESGKLSGTYKGIDLATWSPTSTDFDTAEKLASSKDWDTISKASGVIDLKNAGIDSTSLDSGERVQINDPSIAKFLRYNLYTNDNKGHIIANTSKKAVININGVPYMAIPTEGALATIDPLRRQWVMTGESLRLVALDGSGTSRVLEFNIPATSLEKI